MRSQIQSASQAAHPGLGRAAVLPQRARDAERLPDAREMEILALLLRVNVPAQVGDPSLEGVPQAPSELTNLEYNFGGAACAGRGN